MRIDAQRYFDAILDKMPTREGFDKWVCGALYHVDVDLLERLEKCPQCGNPFHPARGYKPKATADPAMGVKK